MSPLVGRHTLGQHARHDTTFKYAHRAPGSTPDTSEGEMTAREQDRDRDVRRRVILPAGAHARRTSRRDITSGRTRVGRTALRTRRTLTRLLVGDLIEAVLKDLVEMHRLIVAGRHVFARDVKTSGRPWSRRMGTVSRCGRARSHPTPATVTHTTEMYRFMDAALISRKWLRRASAPERHHERRARASIRRATDRKRPTRR